jgi:hypothetical protein
MDPDLLANLYVQLRRLSSSLRLLDVVQAIEETLTNLVGTEDWALFLRDAESGRFELLIASGLGNALGSFAAGEGDLGRAAVSGRIFYGEPLAAVPLRSGLGTAPIGVIAVKRLLAHRTKIGSREQTLFEAFADHAGLALEAALCAEQSGPPSCSVERLRARLQQMLPSTGVAR